MYQFSVEKWGLWDSSESFTQQQNVFSGEFELSNIKPMVKRRMPVLAKQIYGISDNLALAPMPTVYASKNAELNRTIKLIRQYGGDLSPANFSMSVHNAIPGLLSVISTDNSPYTVIDSMSGVLEMAIVEAIGLLSEHSCIRVVYFEEVTPELFTSIISEQDIPMVLVMELKQGKDFSLISLPIDDPSPVNNVSNEHLQKYLAVLNSENSQADITYMRNRWSWVRN